MAFLGPFNAAVPNPSFVELGKAFHRPVEIVTYSTTTGIILGGVAVSCKFISYPVSDVDRVRYRCSAGLRVCVITLYQMPSKARLCAFIHRRTYEYFHSNVMSAVALHPRFNA